MKTYQNHRVEPYFTYLKNGIKTIEGRLQKGWYQEASVGDHIITLNENETDTVETEIVGIRKYASIKEMLEAENLQKMLPDKKTILECIKVYREFYSHEQEKKHGAVAIEVKLVN